MSRFPRLTAEDRLWVLIEECPTTGCWLWSGSIDRLGYGVVWAPDRQREINAHRFAYELLIGPIPEGLELDHLCRTRHCVTHQENMARGALAMKTHCPQGHPYSTENVYLQNGSRHCRPCQQRGGPSVQGTEKAGGMTGPACGGCKECGT